MDRRIPLEDERQIKRWRALRRHVVAIEKNCKRMDLECRKNRGRQYYTGHMIVERYREFL